MRDSRHTSQDAVNIFAKKRSPEAVKQRLIYLGLNEGTSNKMWRPYGAPLIRKAKQTYVIKIPNIEEIEEKIVSVENIEFNPNTLAFVQKNWIRFEEFMILHATKAKCSVLKLSKSIHVLAVVDKTIMFEALKSTDDGIRAIEYTRATEATIYAFFKLHTKEKTSDVAVRELIDCVCSETERIYRHEDNIERWILEGKTPEQIVGFAGLPARRIIETMGVIIRRYNRK
jgi:hypothetical protein